MSRDDLLTLENFASMSRRDLLKMAGVAGVGVGGASTAGMVPQSSTGAVDNQHWVSVLSEVNPPEGANHAVKTTSMLSLLGVTKTPYAGPKSGKEPAWQFTFVLRTHRTDFDRINSDQPWTAHTDGAGRGFHENVEVRAFPSNGSIEFNEDNTIELPDKRELVAVSARRDPTLFQVYGTSMTNEDGENVNRLITDKLLDNPELAKELVRDQTEGTADDTLGVNLARYGSQTPSEFDHDIGVAYEFAKNTGLGLIEISTKWVDVGADTILGLANVIHAFVTDNVPDEVRAKNEGFEFEIATANVCTSGHLLYFDVFVSDAIVEGEPGPSVVIESKVNSGSGFPYDRRWVLQFNRDSDGVSVEPTAFNPNDQSWSISPVPSISPTPDDEDVNLTPGDTQTFKTSGSAYGRFPIDQYVFELYKGEIDGSPLASAESSDPMDPPSITHELEDSAVYRARLELIDTAGQTSTLVEKYPVKGPDAATFTVDLTAPDQVDPNQPIDLSATVTNTGGQQASQEVSIWMDGPNGREEVYTESVDLQPDAQAPVSPSSLPTSGDGGTSLTFTAETEDDMSSTTVTVVAAQDATYTVEIQGTNGPVTVGEQLTVDAQITNTGETAGNPTVSLSMNGTQVASTQPSIAAGASTTVTLSAKPSSAGEKTLTVEAGGASAGITVQVEDEPAAGYFELTLNEPPLQVIAGESASFDVEVRNTGEEIGTRDIELRDASTGEVIDSRTVERLGPGQVQHITLTVPSERTSNPTELAIEFSNGDETVPHTLDVVSTDEVGFEIVDVNAPGQILTNEPLSIFTTIHNTADQGGTGTVEVLLDPTNEQVDATTVDLPSGSRTTVELHGNGDTGFPDPGPFSFDVVTDVDRVSRTVEIVDSNPARFRIPSGVSGPGQVAVGEAITVEATVENTGGQTHTQSVTLRDSLGEVFDTQDVTLDAGQSQSISLSVPASRTTGTRIYNLVFETFDDEKGKTVEVVEPTPANFQVSNVSPASSEITVGDSVDVTATIENTGTETGSKTIELLDGSGSKLDEQSKSIPGGGTASVTLTVPSSRTSSQGTLDLTVETPDDSGSTSVQIDPATPASFQVTSIDAPDKVSVLAFDDNVSDGVVEVTTTVENTGGTAGEQEVVLSTPKSNIGQLDSTNLRLDAGATRSFNLHIGYLSPNRYELVVETDDDSASTNMQVENFDPGVSLSL